MVGGQQQQKQTIDISLIEHSEAFIQFKNSLRSKATKRGYTYYLCQFMKFLGIEDCDSLLSLPPKQIQAKIIEFIVHQRDVSEVSPNSLRLTLASLKHFFEINDIENINWKKVKKFMGEFYTTSEDRPYKRQEIKLLVDSAHNLRDKAIVLLLASSGLRIGGLVKLQLKHLTSVSKYNLYHLSVYKKSKEQYFTFCTPEARKAIDEYLDWRGRVGEKLGPESPLFRLEFDKDNPFAARAPPQPMTIRATFDMIKRLTFETGVKEITHLTENKKQGRPRHNIMTCHGFRKHFSTVLETEGVNIDYIEILLGHKRGLKDVYSKPQPVQILEGNGDKVRGYLSGINALTIDDTHRLRDENQSLKETVAEWAKNRQEMAKLQKRLDEIDRAMGTTKGYS